MKKNTAPAVPTIELTADQRADILTREVAARTAKKLPPKVIAREPHRAWLMFGKMPPSAAHRVTGSTIMLFVHITMAIVTLGLWLLFVLLLGALGGDNVFRVDVVKVTAAGGIETETVRGGKARKLVKRITENS